MMGQNVIALSETTKFIVDNRGKTVPTTKNGIPLIKTNCISNNQLYPRIDGAHFVSEETYENWFRSHPMPGDIIITLKGSQNGAVCFVPNPINFAIAQDMVALRVDEAIIDPHYLFACLRSREVQHQIKTLDVSGVIPHLKKSDFDKLIIPYPERDVQNLIGGIYFKLSQKITLLKKQNQTLEELAQTLFKRWFVENIDESWKETSLSKIADIGIGRTPPRKEDEWFTTSKEDVKWISIKDMGECGVYVSETSEYLTKEAVKRFHIPVIPTNTVVLSFKMTLGRVAITTDEMLSNEAIAHFKIKDEKVITPEFLYFFLKTYRYQKLGSTSSIVTSINSGMIKDMDILIPDKKAMSRFQFASKTMFNTIKNNSKEIQTLTQLRDTLLPKLMSGSLEIKNE